MTPLSNMAEPSPVSRAHTLQCMEIWGGCEAIDSAVSVPGIDAWIASTPYDGAASGGDIHYVSVCACGQISRFALADVSGHGDDASSLADRLRAMMRRYINTPDQTDIVRSLNHDMTRIASHGSFATAVLAAYFPPTDHLIVCNAGHPAPLWYHADAGLWEPLTPQNSRIDQQMRNIPLGIIEETDFIQFAVKLGKGDLVLMFSDAVTEAINEEDGMLGVEGLLAALAAIPADDSSRLLNQLIEVLSLYRGGEPARDDQTLMLLHHNANNPPRLSLGGRLRAVARMIGLTMSANSKSGISKA